MEAPAARPRARDRAAPPRERGAQAAEPPATEVREAFLRVEPGEATRAALRVAGTLVRVAALVPAVAALGARVVAPAMALVAPVEPGAAALVELGAPRMPGVAVPAAWQMRGAVTPGAAQVAELQATRAAEPPDNSSALPRKTAAPRVVAAARPS